MLRPVLPVLFVVLLASPVVAQGPALAPVSVADTYRDVAARIIEAATADSAAYARIAYLCDTFGHRLSGSESLEAAIDWILDEMTADGLEGVRGQPVMVPKWVRGDESAHLVRPRSEALTMLGLGGSVGTPPEGITAPVLVVASFDELAARADEARGKIVLFDVPFTGYGQTVPYRTNGATEAARVGAVASLVRSVGPYSLDTPHTGAMRYAEDVPRIPHAALSMEHAMLLHRLVDQGEEVVVTLRMDARTEPDVLSRNAIAELRGSEYPEQIVVMGGHIDSWDVGQGAVDDGGGSVVAWEALRLLKDLGLRPRRTIRVALWTNEENGLRGGTVYRDSVGTDIGNHVMAIETDGGVFAPVAFGVTASDAAFALVQPIEELLMPILSESPVFETGITRGGGGADIGPLMRDGVPGVSLNTEASRYFWFHHTPADTVDKLDPGDVQRCVAAMAVFAYVVADMPQTLPRDAEQTGGP